jgi:hypothetical protein
MLMQAVWRKNNLSGRARVYTKSLAAAEHGASGGKRPRAHKLPAFRAATFIPSPKQKKTSPEKKTQPTDQTA